MSEEKEIEKPGSKTEDPKPPTNSPPNNGDEDWMAADRDGKLGNF